MYTRSDGTLLQKDTPLLYIHVYIYIYIYPLYTRSDDTLLYKFYAYTSPIEEKERERERNPLL